MAVSGKLGLFSSAPWVPLLGAKVEERGLGLDEVVRGPLEDSSVPAFFSHWGQLVSWLVLTSTYTAVRRRQPDHRQVLHDWWQRTW